MVNCMLGTNGTMSTELFKLITNDKVEADYVVRFDRYRMFLKAFPLILKVSKLMKEDKKDFANVWVKDLGGNEYKVYSSYRNKAIDAGDTIIGLGGLYEFPEKEEHLYLPKGYIVVNSSYKLKPIKYMESISEQEVDLLYNQLETRNDVDERVYYRVLKENLFN